MVVGLQLIVSAASRLPAVLNILNLFNDEKSFIEKTFPSGAFVFGLVKCAFHIPLKFYWMGSLWNHLTNNKSMHTRNVLLRTGWEH